MGWIKRFITFHGRRHPSEMGAFEVIAILTHLAVVRNVAPSTQAQVKSVNLFFYRVVLNTALPWLDDVVAATNPRRLPVVLTVPEVRSVLEQMNGSVGLVCALLYGTGMDLGAAHPGQGRGIQSPGDLGFATAKAARTG